ncbi:MAG TPA: class II aldolase/adducin family protein [Stellaceae bacterium]|nr:class II aldolase/adducin family protein [Stellaceae bacterium]
MANSEIVDDLVVANRILFHEGVLDGFGHASVRDERNPERFLLARSMAAGLVTAEDIMEFDYDGTPLDPRGRAVFLERFIHAEIYRARRDVRAVVHSHSPNLIPFGVTPVPLQPIYHMTGFLGEGVPVFEIRQFAGEDTNMLITDGKLGRALAETLGQKPVALMRGHGSIAVGVSLRQSVYRAIYMEMNARLQSEAMRLGPVNYLTPGEAKGGAEANDRLLERPWALWKRRAMAAG